MRPSLPGRWPLVIVGPSGWGQEPVHPPLADGVVFTGAVSDPVLAGLYQRARAFAYVPLTEGYGLPPLEAMRMGTPSVVANEVPSVHDLGATGRPPAYIVDPLDIDDIARGLYSVLTDDALRVDLASRGSAYALAHLGLRRPRSMWRFGASSVTPPLALARRVRRPAATGRAGYYTMALAAGLAARDDVALTLIGRRDDETRWTGWRPRPRCGPRSRRRAPGPPRLRTGGPPIACCAP